MNKKLLNFGKSVSRTLRVQPDGHGNLPLNHGY